MWILKDYDPYNCDPFNSRVIRKGEKTPSRPNLGGAGEEKANGKFCGPREWHRLGGHPQRLKGKRKLVIWEILREFKEI